MTSIIINHKTSPELSFKNQAFHKPIAEMVKNIYPVLKKHGSNPPKINELMGKNARWSCGVQGIGIKYQKEQSNDMKAESTIIRAIVEASINRKYLLNDDKKNPARFQEIKMVVEELRTMGIYQPKAAFKNQFKGFNFEVESRHGTKIQSINRDSAKILLKLDADLQPVLRTFGLELKNLHETQSTVKEGHNRNHGQVISVKTKDRTYDQIFYTALHELAHSREFNHGPGFKFFLGQLILWCYFNRYPTALIARNLYIMAQNDTKYKPVLKYKADSE